MSRRLLCSLILISLPVAALTKATKDDEVLRPNPAAHVPHLTIPKGSEITIEDYDAKTDTFMLSITEESAVGPNFVTPDMLRRAVAFTGDQRDFMKQKNQMIGSIYQIKTPLPLVYEDEMDRRKKAARSGQRAF